MDFYDLGKPSDLTCEAAHGKPRGQFQWRIGEEDDPQAIFIENDKEIKVVDSERGYETVAQVRNSLIILYIATLTGWSPHMNQFSSWVFKSKIVVWFI